MPTHFAHSLGGVASAPEELREHLCKVAERAKVLAGKAAPTDWSLTTTAEAAGLLHDLGKYRPEWQAYLHGGPQTPHAIHGAAYSEHILNNSPLALVIGGHHAGLHDSVAFFQKLANEEREHQTILKQIVVWAAEEIPNFPTAELPIPFKGDDDRSLRQFEFWTRVLFSLLIDADRLETEQFYTGRARDSRPLVPSQLLQQVKAERDRKAAGKTGVLADLRNRIFDECVRAGGSDRGFFELTVPTGGGKTLSGMAFALAHAVQQGLRRVIVVIPYLSIIEQNAREYQRILGRENVIEHHSAVGEQEKTSADEPTRRSWAELATENWDAPVIVTTSVQFLETLLEASPRRCRKLHNVARSVILFDEAQCLPTHILNPLVSVFRELTDTFGCSAVFSTATQPAFRHGPGLTEGLKPGELKPILPEPLVAESFRSLRRVEYRPELGSTWTWDQLVERLAQKTLHPQALCVLNTRRHAREVWEKLRGKAADKSAVVHLSSAMCAEHRLAVLGDPEIPAPGTVRRRLKDGQPCWLVSTQVIEAGVDVDFPRVFRALGPLDSIVQVGGRCNREGGLRDAAGNPVFGEVVIFQPDDAGIPRGLYQTATGKARAFLGEYTSEQLVMDPAVFAKYFHELYGLADCDTHEIQEKRAQFQYREVAEKARVISDGGTPVIVPYKIATKWIHRIRRTGTFDRAVLRRLQRYTVNVRANDLRQLQALGATQTLLGDDGPLVLDGSAYDDSLGVVIRGLSPDDFLVFDVKD